MGLFSKKKKTDKSKISPKGETKTETPTPAPPPKPPPKGRSKRTKSKTNIIAGIDNITERVFFLEKVVEVVEESTKEKKKRERKEKKLKAMGRPVPPPAPPAPPPRKTYTLNGKHPVIIFGSTTKGNSKNFQAKVVADVRLPPDEPGVGTKHSWICFADDAFWYCHNVSEEFNSSYINDIKVKDAGSKRTYLDGHNTSIPNAAVRLHTNDVITIGAKRSIQMRFITDYTSKYWIEFDKFIRGDRPKPDRKWLKSLGCNVKALTAKKGALAVSSIFKVKKIKQINDAERKLRELEAAAAAKKLAEQKAKVQALRETMKKDFLKVREEKKISNGLIKDLEAKHKREARAMLKKNFLKVKNERNVDNAFADNLARAKEAAAKIEAKRLALEAALAEEQRKLREAEEARRVAEKKAALAKHRFLGANNKIINANRMQSALDMLREAQEEKLRQEAEEQRKIEEARAKEEARIQSEINKMRKKFDKAIEQGNYKKLQRCMDEMESLEPEVKKALAKEMKEAKETFDKVSSMLTVKERQELEKDRIIASKKLIIRLKNSTDSDDHYQLLRELEVIRKDEVLATAPQLQEELAAIQKLIAERQAEQKRLLQALDEALKGDDKDVSKKLKIVEAAKAALGNFKNLNE